MALVCDVFICKSAVVKHCFIKKENPTKKNLSVKVNDMSFHWSVKVIGPLSFAQNVLKL